MFGPTDIYNINKLLNEHAPSHANEMRTAESIGKFIKNKTDNVAQIDDNELESLAVIVDDLLNM